MQKPVLSVLINVNQRCATDLDVHFSFQVPLIAVDGAFRIRAALSALTPVILKVLLKESMAF